MTHYNFFEVFYLLLIAHAVCDFALQNDYVAQAKNRHTELGKDVWWMVLPAHALIHAGGTYIVTQSFLLSLIQLVTHITIDFKKCEQEFGYVMDQAMHVGVILLISVIYIL